MTTWTKNTTKNIATYTMQPRGDNNRTWNDMNVSWDNVTGTWDAPGTQFTKMTKHSTSFSSPNRN